MILKDLIKRFMKNPWVISIGSGLVILIATIIIDAVTAKQVFSTICQIITVIWNGMLAFLNCEIKVWWLLISFILLFLVLIVVLRRKKFPEHSNELIKYNEDYILGFKWRWTWEKDIYGEYYIYNLHPVCKNCNTPLVVDDTKCYTPRLKCLRCNQTVNKEMPKEANVKLLISDNAKRILDSHKKAE